MLKRNKTDEKFNLYQIHSVYSQHACNEATNLKKVFEENTSIWRTHFGDNLIEINVSYVQLVQRLTIKFLAIRTENSREH